MNTVCFVTYEDGSGREHSIYFNAVLGQTHEHTSEVTEHPIEDGSTVTDHVIQKNDRFTMEGVVSNEPITPDDNFGGNAHGGEVVGVRLDVPSYEPPLAPTPGALFSAVGSALKNLIMGKPEYYAQILRFGEKFDATYNVHNVLKEIKDTAKICTVHTSTILYESMILTGVSAPKVSSDGTGLRFNLEFRKIRKVESLLVDAPKPSIPAAAPKKPKGPQAGVPTPPAKKKSVAKALAGNFFQ